MKPGGGRVKGSSFERKVAKMFSEWCGHKVNRTPLSGGWGNAAAHGTCGDLVVEKKYQKLFPFTIECKCHEKWCLDDLLHNEKSQIYKWWNQAKVEARHAKKIPLLVMARNFVQPIIFMRQADFSPGNLWTPLSDAFMFYLTKPGSPIGEEVLIMRLDAFLRTWPAPQKPKRRCTQCNAKLGKLSRTRGDGLCKKHTKVQS